MGRFYRMNYIHRLANQALAAGDTAAYTFFHEQTLICKESLFVYTEAYRAQNRGDHATFSSRYLELQALLAQLAPLPTPDTPPHQLR